MLALIKIQCMLGIVHSVARQPLAADKSKGPWPSMKSTIGLVGDGGMIAT